VCLTLDLSGGTDGHPDVGFPPIDAVGIIDTTHRIGHLDYAVDTARLRKKLYRKREEKENAKWRKKDG
jgi:hypothetical protein